MLLQHKMPNFAKIRWLSRTKDWRKNKLYWDNKRNSRKIVRTLESSFINKKFNRKSWLKKRSNGLEKSTWHIWSWSKQICWRLATINWACSQHLNHFINLSRRFKFACVDSLEQRCSVNSAKDNIIAVVCTKVLLAKTLCAHPANCTYSILFQYQWWLLLNLFLFKEEHQITKKSSQTLKSLNSKKMLDYKLNSKSK